MKLKFILLSVCSIIIMFSMSLLIYAKDAQIDGDHLNVRSGPGTEYDTVTQVDPPEQYPILEEQGEWIKIQLPEQEGWVHQDFLTIIEDDAEINTTEPAPEAKEEVEDAIENKQTEQETSPSNDTNKPSLNGLANKIIVIDPGHGGRDVGAIGSSGGYESDYVLKTAEALQAELEKYGANVFLTRDNDQYVSLTSRTSFSNLKNADVFLSLHYNSTPEYPNVQGIDTYYYSQRDEQLAKYVHAGILEHTDMEDRGIENGDLQVLRTNHRPSLLLELGFISNESEEEHIQSKAYLEAMSRGVVTGLHHYFR